MRIRVEQSGVITAPPPLVYETIANLGGRPKWLDEMDDVEAPPGVARAGTRFAGRSRMFGHHFLGVSEVVVADADRTLVEEVYLGAHFRSTWTVEGDGAATHLTHRMELDFPRGPVAPLARWLLRRRLARLERSSFRALNELLSRGS